MLLGVVWVHDHSSPIGVGKASLHILPEVVEVHNLVVVELLLVEVHLLLIDLFLALNPLVRPCELQVRLVASGSSLSDLIESIRLD